jgi:hypothetical protein
VKYKVVYNDCYGGFSLSELAIELLVQQGHVNPYDLPRHHPHLVAMVSILGKKANGEYANLDIREVSGKYFIRDYDGQENVVEPQDLEWADPEKY